MLIEENPFPANMLQCKAESAASEDDSDNTKTVDRPTEDVVHPIKVEPTLATIVVKISNMEFNASGGNSHLRTYKPKADVVDGKWRDGHPQPRRVRKPAVTFSQLLAKYERLGRKEKRRAQENKP